MPRGLGLDCNATSHLRPCVAHTAGRRGLVAGTTRVYACRCCLHTCLYTCLCKCPYTCVCTCLYACLSTHLHEYAPYPQWRLDGYVYFRLSGTHVAAAQGDVFVLDTGTRLYQWQGETSGIFEKTKDPAPPVDHRHNYIGQNHVGHNYMGHNHMGYNYI